MALPSNALSPTPVVGNYLSPDNRTRELLVDYELGGTALYDTSEGSDYQVWTLTYETPDVIVQAANGSPITLFSFTGITEVSLAFDQNMNPFVAYVRDNEAWYWWYDTVAVDQVHTQMATTVTNPRCTLDDKRATQTGSSDIILAYIREGGLYFRQQRDRYGVEYELATGVTGALVRIGMGDNLRLHFGLTGSTIEATPPPDPEAQDELVYPYYNDTGNYIDLTALDTVTFAEMFGVAADGADFDGSYLGNRKALISSISETGNRIQLRDSVNYTAGGLYICDTSGNVVSSMVYNNTTIGESLEIPAGADYYVVLTTDNLVASVKKWQSTATVVDGSVPWSEFASGYDFGELPSVTVNRRNIPAGGISFRFTVPSTSTAIRAGFAINYLNGFPGGLADFSISTTAGDYSAIPNNSERGDSITGGINLAGADITLVPGNTYYWNIRFQNLGESTITLTHSYREV